MAFQTVFLEKLCQSWGRSGGSCGSVSGREDGHAKNTCEAQQLGAPSPCFWRVFFWGHRKGWGLGALLSHPVEKPGVKQKLRENANFADLRPSKAAVLSFLWSVPI